MKTTFLLILTTFYINHLFGQQLSQLPKIRNFQKNEYRALPQSWDIVQDKKRMLYFGNNDGLLQFDGENWTSFPLPNKSIVRSLYYRNDTIYIGGQGEIGFFPLEGQNQFTYHSLSAKLHKIDFEDVWNIVEDKNGNIIFHSAQNDYQYAHHVLSKIPHYNGEFLFLFNHQLISSEDKLLQEISFPYALQSIQKVKDQKYLLFTKDYGIYSTDLKSYFPIRSKEMSTIQKAGIYSVIPLHSKHSINHYAIGTVRDGVFIIDEYGNIKAHYNRENGLSNNTVLSMYQDRDNELWCALDNGISKIDIFSGISYFSENIGFNPSVYDVKKFDQYYYVGTNQGIYRRLKTNTKHEKVLGIDDQVWKIFIWNNQLYVAHNKGLSILKGTVFETVFDSEGVWDGQSLLIDKSYLLLGTYKGFRLMDKNHIVSDVIKGMDVTARIFIQLDNGEIWMSHGYKGVYKCKLGDQLSSFSNVEFYNQDNGLPASIFNNVFKINEKLYVGSLKGISIYNTTSNSFETTTSIAQYNFNDSSHIKYLKSDNDDKLWVLSEHNFTAIGPQSIHVFNNFLGNFVAGFEFIYEENDGNFIIGMEEGYVQLSTSLHQEIIHPLKTFITTLEIGNEVEYLRLHQDKIRTDEIPFDRNQLTFRFTTPYYKNIDYNQYRYILEGFDQKWSDWSTKDFQNYSFLNEGTYTFKVQSRNVNNQLSDITTYTFEITPPWYRQKVAYFLYSFLFLSFFISTIFFLKHRAKREKKYLMLKQANEMQEMENKMMKEVVDSKTEIDRLKNEALQSEIKNKNQELAAVTMAIMQKNQGLQSIKDSLIEKFKDSKDKDLKRIIKKIDEATDVENDWDEFSIRFDQVYDNFFEKLKSKYPELTHRDVQICAYLKMKLSSKEIANTLNISVRSVEQSRYRLRKKMGLSHEENLLDKILGI